MATKKNNADQDIYVAIVCAAVAVLFSLYHFFKLKAKYITGTHTRRIF